MASSQLSARKAAFSTSALSGVDLSSATLMGELASDSQIPEPESTYDSFMGGDAEVLADVALDLRIAGGGGSWLATLKTAKDANPPTELYIYIINRSGKAYTRYGPCTIKKAFALGDTSEPKRQSTRVQANSRNDTAEETLLRVTGTIVLPT